MEDRSKVFLAHGVAALALGVGVLLLTATSLGAPNVSYARTESTALLSMALASVAIWVYVAGKSDGPWWRAFWTAAYLAYALHFFWAIFRTYHEDFGAVFERQGFLTAASNFALTVVWGLYVVALWLPKKWRPTIPNWLHFSVFLWVTASFIVAASSRTWFGYALVGLILVRLYLNFRTLLADIFKPKPA